MPGMEIPTPGGTMKKMQFEFTDPSEAQPTPQIPPGVGVPPAGAQQQPVMPAGAQGPQQGAAGSMFSDFGQQAQGFGGDGDSSLFSDEQLAQMVQGDPIDYAGEDLYNSLMNEQMAPDEEMQMRMMQAARRAGGF